MEFKIGDMVKVDFPENFPKEEISQYGGSSPFKIETITTCIIGPCGNLGCEDKINGMCFGLNTFDPNGHIVYSLKKVGNVNCPDIVVKGWDD